MITCGWCSTHYPSWQTNCKNCGGPLPPLPGMELGSPPPPAPRKLPWIYEFRMKWSRNFGVLIGLFFCFISGLMLYAMIKVHTLFAVVPGFFLFLGLMVVWHC